MLIEIVNPTDKREQLRGSTAYKHRVFRRVERNLPSRRERELLLYAWSIRRYDPVSIAVASHFFPPLSAVIKPHRWHIFLSMFMDRAMIRSWMERGKFFLFVTSRDIDF